MTFIEGVPLAGFWILGGALAVTLLVRICAVFYDYLATIITGPDKTDVELYEDPDGNKWVKIKK